MAREVPVNGVLAVLKLKAPVLPAGFHQPLHTGLEVTVTGLIREMILLPNAAAEFAAQFPRPVKSSACLGKLRLPLTWLTDPTDWAPVS